MAQLFPPENGQGPARFRRWYVDDVSGAMVSEDHAFRDRYGRLVDIRDHDELARDDYLENWDYRGDDDPPGPDEDY